MSASAITTTDQKVEWFFRSTNALRNIWSQFKMLGPWGVNWSDLCFGDSLVAQNCSGEWNENVYEHWARHSIY